MGINTKDFYCITITEYELRLQGNANKSVIDKLKNMGIDLTLDSGSWLRGTTIIDETPINFTLTF